MDIGSHRNLTKFVVLQGQLSNVHETHGSSQSSTTNNISAPSVGSKMPPLIRDLLTAVDDKEWQHALFNLLQNQTYNQCEVDLFELLCKVLDQNLFAQVDWARNSVFFKDLKVILFGYFWLVGIYFELLNSLMNLELSRSHIALQSFLCIK